MLWDVLDAKFKSNSKAAAALHLRWKRLARAEAGRVSVESLATKIGDLRRGRTDWWSRRPKLAELLADLIECDVEDLLGQSSAPTGSLRFPEFPGLPPLLPGEEPCRIDRGGWLRELVLEASGPRTRRWITAGPGMGKSFVIRWLQTHAEDDYAATSVRTLAGAAELFGDARCLVIDVDEPDPRTDEEALRVLGQRGTITIILAGHPRPSPPIGGGGGKASEPTWDEHSIVFSHQARERFLRWIDQRLEASDGDTRLDLDKALQFLHAEDPDLRLVATPADLLAFCADVHIFGPDPASWETRARRWLSAIGSKLLPADTPPTWARLLERTCDSLCAATLTQREYAWGPLPGEAWAAFLPAGIRGSDKDQLGASMIVDYLRGAGLLRGADGGLAFSPSWVRDGLATAALDLAIETDDPGVWGLLAADRSRQRLVDDALDRRADAAFCATVRTVVSKSRHSLGLVAAHEAVFAAAARRLVAGDFVVPHEDLGPWQRLVELQIGSSLKDEHGLAYPFTRRDRDDFWADTWTMSLRVPPPPEFAHPDLMWRLPGWFENLDWSQLPRRWPWSFVSPVRAGRAVRQMVVQALDVLPRLRALPEDIDVPRVLLPAAVLLASTQGWTLTPKMLGSLPGSWEAWALLQLAKERSPDEHAAIADLFWDRLPFVHAPSGERAPVTLRLARLKNSCPDLLPFIVENLSEEALNRTINTDGIQRHPEETDDLLLLPRPLRRIVAQAVLAGRPGDRPAWFAARAIARIFDAEDIDLIVGVIRESDEYVAAEFTGFVWRIAPSSAREEATRALTEGRSSAHAWFFHAPRHELVGLVELLQRMPGPLPSWIPTWAEKRILDAGPVAEALFELTRP